MNVTCSNSSTGCPIQLSSKCVTYEGTALSYIGVSTNDTLEAVIQKLNTAFATVSGIQSAIWGNIEGDIEDQTDLISYLNTNYITNEVADDSFWKTAGFTSLVDHTNISFSERELQFSSSKLNFSLNGSSSDPGYTLSIEGTSNKAASIIGDVANSRLMIRAYDGIIGFKSILVDWTSTNPIFIDDTIASIGLAYVDDYSTSGIAWGDRWIPDLGYISSNFVDLAGDQNITGKKVFSNGLNLGTTSPGSPSNGDFWYSNILGVFQGRISGTSRSMMSTDNLSGAGRIPYNAGTNAVFLTESGFEYTQAQHTLTVGRVVISNTATGLAPFLITSGTLISTEVAGTIENDGTHLYWTDDSGTRYQLDQQGGGGITNGAAANEVMKSDGTNAVSSGLYSTDTGNQVTIHLNTTDANDNKILTLASGGAASTARGAYLRLYGNEASTNPDSAFIIAGENGFVQLEGAYINVDGARIHTTGSSSSNFFAGPTSANLLVTGTFNTGVGAGVFTALTSGISNVGFGVEALKSLTSGNYNTAIGGEALEAAVSTLYGTAIGFQSLNLATGNSNIGIGYRAGDNITSGESNVIIGTDIDAQSATANGQLSIQNIILGQGNSATGTTISSGTIGIGQVPFTGSRLAITGLGNDENTIALDVRNTDGAIFGVDDAGNVIIGNTGGFTTGAGSIVLFNADTAPSVSPSQGIHIYSQDSGDSNATLALYTEQSVEAIGTFTPSHKLKIRINGTEYWIQLDAV